VSTAATALGARSRRGSIVVTTAVSIAGVGFNLIRLQLRLDRGPYLASVVAFLGFGVAALAAAHITGTTRGELGLIRPRWRRLALGGALAAAVMIGMAFATAPLTRLPDFGQLVDGLVLFGLCTAPAEELMFRGLLYALIDRRLGPVAAVAVSSVAFAAAHIPVYGLASLPVAVAAGLLLGWLRWWSGSLAGPWAVHTVADLSLLWL